MTGIPAKDHGNCLSVIGGLRCRCHFYDISNYRCLSELLVLPRRRVVECLSVDCLCRWYNITILMALAIKCIHNLPLHLSYVFALPGILQGGPKKPHPYILLFVMLLYLFTFTNNILCELKLCSRHIEAQTKLVCQQVVQNNYNRVSTPTSLYHNGKTQQQCMVMPISK